MRPASHPDAAETEERGLIEQLSALRSLIPYVLPPGDMSAKLRTGIAIFLVVVSQFILVGAPFFLGNAQDAVADAVGRGDAFAQVGLFIAFFVMGYGALRLLSTLFSEAREYVFAPVAQQAQRKIATETFAHLHRLSLRYHLAKRTGGLSRIIERGVRAIDFLFRFLLFNIGPTLLQLLIAGAAFAIAYNGWFAVIAIVVVVTYVAFTVMTTEWRLKFRREMNRRDTESWARAVDSLLNYETVKYFDAEGREVKRYDVAMAAYAQAAIRSKTSLATVNIGQSLLMNAGIVASMVLAAFYILGGDMSTGDMLTITLVLNQLYRPLNILGFAYREIKQALTDLERMFQLLEEPPEVIDAPHAQPITDVRGRIEFEDVDFHYDDDRQILSGLSFTAEPGQTVAVVGPTGAGKSTLSRILYRFYDIAGGAVRIDGHDIRDITQASLRAAIGMVPQDTVLFNDTIGYNIGYAKPDASQSEIEQAAADAQIHDFIATLPKGYDTMVGERGLKLSGGEKQRVAIARTLLKDPAILILDEATSALDSATEKDIQVALSLASEGRTTLVVAHRLSTVQDADLILVMDQGRIVERGTHAELLSQAGLYAELWHRQDTVDA
ncbi:metal ABC transporter permease [Algimonas arctica]|uniref:Metal ABC transporter permease n=1 Tax=Algimonas arctica TaxID=1479486 RepID=A0A8J3G3D6_9PROT|nr:ABC transporter ATP-binding protein/permease [Algimonas arctica]GHB04440.1 metal ABC transporter permease [Algimonas arctica]